MISRLGLSNDLAGQYARRVEVALRRGAWAEARAVVDQAEQEASVPEIAEWDGDPRDVCLAETGLPLRIVTLLGKHGILTVGELLDVPITRLMRRQQVGTATMKAILDALLPYGLTRNDFREF